MVALVYLVAGISSRFNNQPKHLSCVGPNNETLIEYSLNEALKTPFNNIFLIVSPKTKEGLYKLLGDSYKNIKITYVTQKYDTITRDKPWGTGDAISLLDGIVTTDFIVCNGDDLYGESTFKKCYDALLDTEKMNVTMAFILKNGLPTSGKVNRGIYKFKDIKIKKYLEVASLVETFNIEKKKLTETELEQYISMNFFGLRKEILPVLNQMNKQFKLDNMNERTKENLLPVNLGQLIKDNKTILIAVPTQEKCNGITNPGDEIILKKQLEQNN